MNERKVMVSACLLGISCRYDGKAKPQPELTRKFEGYRIIAFCPESLGQLPIPRLPAEIQRGDGAAVLAGDALVLNREGEDYTLQFKLGAEATLQLYRKHQPELVICKAHSPSCGVGKIYDGTFSGRLRPGDGVTAALLRANGANLCTEMDILQNKPKNNF